MLGLVYDSFTTTCSELGRKAKIGFRSSQPNQQCGLNELPTELRCKNLIDKHRMTLNWRQTCNVYAMCMYSDSQFPFCIPP